MPLTLAEIAIYIPGAISLLEKHGLDFYQNGNRTLSSACLEKGIHQADLDQELNELQKHPEAKNWEVLTEMGIGRLIDFIHSKYHVHEEAHLSEINQNLHQLTSELGLLHPLYAQLHNLGVQFGQLTLQLLDHCEKEEHQLFPYIKQLMDLRHQKSNVVTPQAQWLIKNPIRILEQEHRSAAHIMQKIRQTANHFNAQESDPEEFRNLLNQCKAFEVELHLHLHLENNILFPKLLLLEEEINKKLNISKPLPC